MSEDSLEKMGILKCPYCGMFFPSRESLAAHLNNVHLKNILRYKYGIEA
jgi:uncharacterized C2H2 Zn-finger protein